MNIRWFYPAVFLLNRLRFPQKFALISLLFALPLGLVIYFLCNSIDEQVQIARLEIDGIEYLTPLQKLGEQIPQAMSLAHASLEKQAFAAEHLPTRQAEIDGIMEQLAEIDQRLGGELQTTQRFRVLRAAWEDLKDQTPKLTPEIADDQFRKMGQEVRDLMAYVGDQSTLILDPDLDSYYLMDAVLLKLPASLEMVSEARYLVARQLQPGHTLDAADDAKLAIRSGLLNANLEQLERGFGVAFDHNPSGGARIALDSTLSQHLSATRSLLRVLDNATVNRTVPMNAEQFQNIASVCVVSISRLWDHSAAELTSILHFRIHGLRVRLIQLIGIALAAVLVVTYLWIGFYKAVMQTVRGMQDAAARMAEGHQDVTVELQTRDELSAAARAFNSVAVQLQQTGARFQRIFEGSLDGIFQTSIDGRYLAANHALAEIYGYASPEELMAECSEIGRQIYVDPNRRDEFVAAIIQNGTVTDFESQIWRRDGSVIWITENARLIYDEHGAPLHYEGIIRDITAEKQAREALGDAVAAAESANRAKTEFLANMSHEIRTPMNAILGFSELLTGLVREPKARSYLSAIHSSGHTLLQLINDILDLSKIEAGKLELEYEKLSVGAILREVQQIFSQKAAQKDVQLRVEIDPGLPSGLMLDEIRLRQILFNSVGNALKFTEEGSVLMRALREPIPGRADVVRLVLEVEDTGIGIPESEQTRIFEAFTQQAGQSTKKHGGTGLGLTITQRLVEMMGGKISLWSVPGEGSRFRFTFDEVAVASVDLAPPRDIAPVASIDDFEPATVLVVDDVELNRDLFRAFFENTRHRFVEAVNGREGIEAARRERPDLILMDVRMPVMDGVQATRILKADPELKHIPIVIVTASAMRSEEQELKPIADGFLRKPVSRAELTSQLQHFWKGTTDRPDADGAQPSYVDTLLPGEETIDPDAPERTAELLAALGPLEAEVWAAIQGAPVVSEAAEFGEALRALALEFSSPRLWQYAQRLITQTDSFELTEMEVTLHDFPEVLSLLRQSSGPVPSVLPVAS